MTVGNGRPSVSSLWWIAFLFITIFAGSVKGAIIVNNISSANATNTSSLTWSHTVGGGNNRALVVGIAIGKSTASCTNVTYGGVAMTKLGESVVDTENRASLWILIAPAVGAASVVATISTNADFIGGAFSFTGVDPSTPNGTFVSAIGVSTAPSVTVSSAAGELIVDTLSAYGDALSATVGASQTQRWNALTGTGTTNAIGAGSTAAGAASVAMAWTLGVSKRWAMAAIPLKPLNGAPIWDGGAADNNWGSDTNWISDASPANAGTANIVLAGSTRVTPNVDVTWDVLGLTFSNNASAFTLSGSQLTVRGAGITNNSTSLETINNNLVIQSAQNWNAASGNLTLGGVLSGSASPTKIGTGTLTLSGSSANTLSGTLTVNEGLLLLNKTAGVNAFAGALTIGDGTGGDDADIVRLNAANQIPVVTLTINSSGWLDLNGKAETIGAFTMNGGHVSSSSGTLTVSGDITANASSSTATIEGNLAMSGNRYFNVYDGAQNNDLVISASISGSGWLDKFYAGRLVLSGSNSYSGIMYVESGYLRLQNSYALGTTAGGTVISNAGALEIDGGIAIGTETLSLQGGGPSGSGALVNVSGNNSWAGAVTLAAASVVGSDAGQLTSSGAVNNGGFYLTNTGAGAVIYSGVVSGAGAFIKNGAGTMTLSGAGNNTFTADSYVNGGTLLLNKTAGIDAVAARTYVGDGTGGLEVDVLRWQADNQINDADEVRVLTSGLVDLNGYSDKFKLAAMTGGKVTTAGGTLTMAAQLSTTATNATAVIEGNVNLGAARDFTVNDGSPDVDLFVPALLSGAYNLEKKGAGTLVLGGASTFSGGMTVTAGPLGISNNAAVGSGTLTFNGGSIRAETTARTVTNSIVFANNATIVGSQDLTFAGNAALGNNRTIIASNTGITTFSGSFSGAYSLSNTGPGLVVYSGANTHDETMVYGTLRIQNNSALSGTSLGTWVFSGGALQLSGNITIGAEPLTLRGSGVSSDGALRNISGNNSWAGTITLAAASTIASDSGTLTISSNIVNAGFATTFSGAGNETVSGVISGTGGLTKSGTGKLTLSGSNTFTGALAVNAGTLALGAANRIATVAMTLGGGIFDLAGYNETVGTLGVTANSFIDCGSGASVLRFSDSSAVSWTAGATLTISNWSGNALGGGTDQIIFGSTSNALTATQLSKVRFFTGVESEPALILSTGEIVPGGRQAEVSTTKTGATNIVAGANLTYIITISNAGPSTASNIVVSDVIPPQSTFFTASTGGSYSAGTVTWTAFNLADEGTTNLTVTVTAPGSGSITNTVSSTGATYDPDASNNNGSAAGAKVTTDVTLQGNAGNDNSSCMNATNVSTKTWSHTVNSGNNRILIVGLSLTDETRTISSITYGGTALTRITSSAVKNRVEIWRLVAPTVGTANIVATWSANTDVIGWGGTFTNIDQTNPIGGTGTASGLDKFPTVTLSASAGDIVVDTVAPQGDGGALTVGGGQNQICNGLTGTSSSDSRGGSSYEAGASSVTMSWSQVNSKNWDIAAVVLKAAPPPQADVATTKTGASTVYATSNLTYTITVTNHGPTTASNVVVSDTLPAGLAFVSASSGGTSNNGVVTWPTMTNFVYGSTTNFTVIVTAPTSGSLTNTVSSTSTISDPVASNNNGTDSSAKVITDVTPIANVKTTKSGAATVYATSNLTYTITVTNFGPNTATNVIVSDLLPTNVTFVSASSSGTNGDGTVRWPTISTFAPGATTNFTVTITAPISGLLTNTASSTNTTIDPDTSNNDGSASNAKVTTTVLQIADVKVAKSGASSVYASSNLTYTVSVTNLGPNTATNVIVSDRFPTNTTFVSASSGGTNGNGTVFWPTMTNLLAGASTNFTITITAPTSGPLTNTASSTATSTDPDASNNNGTASNAKVITSVTPIADVQTTKTGAATVYATSNLTYTITVTNFGPNAATEVSVTDLLPTNSTFVSASSGGTNDNGTVTWPTLATFAVGATTNFTVTVTLPGSGSHTNTVSSSATISDPDSSNNDGSSSNAKVITTVTPIADVKTTKSGATSVYATSNLTYTITVTNMGPDIATNLIVSDLLPTNVTFVSATSSGTNGNGTIWWPTMANFAVGATTNFTVIVTVPSTAVSLTNTVSSTNTTTDPDLSNNNGTASAAKVTTTVLPIADVKTTKTGASTVTATSNLTYTITVTNMGPNTATNLIVSDVWPTNSTFVSATSGGTNGNGTVVWPTMTNCAVGFTTNFTVTITAPSSGSLTNTVSSTATSTDPDASNNDGSASNAKVTTTVLQIADVKTTKSGAASVLGGNNLIYTITVTNLGPNTATNVVVSDLLPTNTTFVSASSGGTNGSGTVTWPTMTNFASAATTNFTVTVTVPDRGILTNVVSSTSDTSDPDASNNNGSSAAGKVITLILGVNVTGYVYLDANKNGFKDSTEAGTSLSLYAKIYATTNASGPALQAATVDGTTGAYTLTNIYRGLYMVIIDNNNLLSDVTPTLPAGWTGGEMPAQLRTNVAVAYVNVPNQNFGLIHSLGLSGKVFKDTGGGGGTANDGVVNGGETGLGGVMVRLTDSTGSTVHDTATTDGSGNYTLLIPSTVANGATLKVTETNPPVHLSTGGSAGDTGGTYDRASDTVSFTYTSGAVYSGVNFGDVPDNSFVNDSQQANLPGTFVLHPHSFVAGSGGSLTFSVANLPNPTVAGWTQVIYRDANCNGQLDPGETAVSGAVTVSAGDKVCILIKEFIPGIAPFNAQDQLTVTAAFTWTSASPALSTNTTRIDLTTAGNPTTAGLTLVKAVDKETALPGEVLTYTVTYANHSSAALTNIVIFDQTPAFTTFSSAGYGALPNSVTGIAVTSPGVGASGAIKWTFTGSLAPASASTVSFSVTVSQ